jgi:hypothetical protein
MVATSLSCTIAAGSRATRHFGIPYLVRRTLLPSRIGDCRTSVAVQKRACEKSKTAVLIRR